MPLRLLCLSVLCLCSVVASAETSWIWGAKNNIAKQEVWFRTSFELKEVPAKALLQAAADNHCVVWLNGKALGGSDDWAEALAIPVEHYRGLLHGYCSPALENLLTKIADWQDEALIGD